MPASVAVSRGNAARARPSLLLAADVLRPLYGRSVECARIDALLANARCGRSGALVVCGAAGTGKTTLLAHAVEEAEGFAVLQAAGIEAESEISFSGLDTLLAPIADLVEEIPEPQREALHAALDVAPRKTLAHGAVCRAVLSVLAAASEVAPVLCVIDDAPILDPASASALAFVARRLKSEGVAMVFATGDDEPPLLAGLEKLHLHGLDPETARALLEQRAGTNVASDVARRLTESSGGNPRALVDAAAALTADELVGLVPLPIPLPLGPAGGDAYLDAAASLSRSAREALVTVAAADTQTLRAIAQDATVIGITAAALEECEAANLIEFENGRLQFPQPLARGAIYRAAPAARQRAAHRALAAVSSGERRALHLATAATGPDEAVAVELETAAESALRRGSLVVASQWFLRAANFSPGRGAWARRLYRAADAAWRGGQAAGAEQLVEQANDAEDHTLRADFEHLRAKIELESSRGPAAYRRLLRAAKQMERSDPRHAARLLTTAVAAAPHEQRLAVAHEAHELARGDGGKTELLSTTALARTLLANGNYEEGSDLLPRARSLLESNGELAEDAEVLLDCAGAFTEASWDYELAHKLVTDAIALSRDRGALATLPVALLQLARLHLLAGRWTDAFAIGSEALDFAREAQQERTIVDALGVLARLDAVRGNTSECLRRVEQITNFAGREAAGLRTTVGLLALGQGDAIEAMTQLEEIAPEKAPDLIEACVRAGRSDKARQFAAVDEHANDSWGRVRTSWSEGLLAGEDEYEGAFAEAMAALERFAGFCSFERARLQLNWGERLRRSGHRIAAREQLLAAHDAFELLGAEPWAQRARVELRASGETARRRDPSTLDELTPQELQVVREIAAGNTYRGAAQNLFLSPKTIEYHLRKVYRKLGVKSRQQLVARLETIENSVAKGGSEQ
jgi:DNA-binding CsgD family transcriptional regulator/tetratricopeptide (TPR) repeat protein